MSNNHKLLQVSLGLCAANPTRAMKEEWNRDTKAAYGLTAEQLAEVDAQLEEIAASRALIAGPSSPACVPLADLMGEHSLQRLLGVDCEGHVDLGPTVGIHARIPEWKDVARCK